MNFGKCSSVLFTYSRPRRLPSVKIASRGCGVGGGGGGGGGGGWGGGGGGGGTGRILEPAVGDDENAGKPSS